MGSVSLEVARQLRDLLGIRRAVETGTYLGEGARRLASVFPEVVTVELSKELHRDAEIALADTPAIRAVQGDSVTVLPSLANASLPTLWFLDGHWSTGVTAGEAAQCPIIAELDALGTGHPNDCYLIDDARYLAAPPRPPYDPSQWPSLVEVIDKIREVRPDHHVTVLDDQVVAVPARAKATVDRYGQALADLMAPPLPLADRIAGPVLRLLRRS